MHLPILYTFDVLYRIASAIARTTLHFILEGFGGSSHFKDGVFSLPVPCDSLRSHKSKISVDHELLSNQAPGQTEPYEALFISTLPFLFSIEGLSISGAWWVYIASHDCRLLATLIVSVRNYVGKGYL